MSNCNNRNYHQTCSRNFVSEKQIPDVSSNADERKDLGRREHAAIPVRYSVLIDTRQKRSASYNEAKEVETLR